MRKKARETKCAHIYICVCVCVREREILKACVLVRERLRVCVCVCFSLKACPALHKGIVMFGQSKPGRVSQRKYGPNIKSLVW